MERGESAGQSYCGGHWVALPDERAHGNTLRLARMHPVIAFEGVAEGQNLCDLRRCAVVYHLHVLARSQMLQADLQDAA